jgi:hypothetical protein
MDEVDGWARRMMIWLFVDAAGWNGREGTARKVLSCSREREGTTGGSGLNKKYKKYKVLYNGHEVP